MNKKKLMELIARKEARKAELCARSSKTEDIAELRSINTELENLNSELSELRGIVDSIAGILAALPMTRSATFFALDEIWQSLKKSQGNKVIK